MRTKTTSGIRRASSAKTPATTSSIERTKWAGIEATNKEIKTHLQVSLPKPPSVNHLWGYTCQKGFARSYVTQEGRLWYQEAGIKLHEQIGHPEPILELCEIFVLLKTARPGQQDIDNIMKPLLDLFQKEGIVKNDSQFYEMRGRKMKVKKEAEGVVVEIRPLQDWQNPDILAPQAPSPVHAQTKEAHDSSHLLHSK